MLKKITLSFSLFIILFISTFLIIWKETDIKTQIIMSAKFSYEDESVYPFKYDNDFYVVIPSYWDTNNITISSDIPFYLDGLSLKNGTYSIEIGRKYSIPGRAAFLTIENTDLPSVFINLSSNSLKKLNKNKKNKEDAIFYLYDADGNKLISEDIQIKGRGNASWNLDKKSYNVTFEEEISFLSLKESSQFTLLANQNDDSGLRNAIAFDLAKQIGLSFTPDYEYVNIYYNGEYYGLYMVTNKLDVNSSSVNINDLSENNTLANAYIKTPLIRDEGNIKYASNYDDPSDITGGYLLELFVSNDNRYDEQSSGFVCSNGQAVSIKSPKYASKNEVTYIYELFQDFIDAVMSDNGYNNKEKHYSEYIDIDSFVNYYIFTELLEPNDANKYSFFIYKDSELVDTKLHAGPVWDYDNSLANPRTLPNTSIFANAIYAGSYIENSENKGLLFYLLKHKDFCNSVKSRWTEISKIIDLYLDNDYNNLTTYVYNDTFFNNIKNNLAIFYDQYNNNISLFLSERKDFLNYYFLSDEEKVSIEIISNEDFNYCVPVFYINKGSNFNYPYFSFESNTDYIGLYYLNTNTQFKKGDIVNENIILEARYNNDR